MQWTNVVNSLALPCSDAELISPWAVSSCSNVCAPLKQGFAMHTDVALSQRAIMSGACSAVIKGYHGLQE